MYTHKILHLKNIFSVFFLKSCSGWIFNFVECIAHRLAFVLIFWFHLNFVANILNTFDVNFPFKTPKGAKLKKRIVKKKIKTRRNYPNLSHYKFTTTKTLMLFSSNVKMRQTNWIPFLRRRKWRCSKIQIQRKRNHLTSAKTRFRFPKILNLDVATNCVERD